MVGFCHFFSFLVSVREKLKKHSHLDHPVIWIRDKEKWCDMTKVGSLRHSVHRAEQVVQTVTLPRALLMIMKIDVYGTWESISTNQPFKLT